MPPTDILPSSRRRLFYALWPDDATRLALQALQEEIPGRRIRPDNLHMTLAFLGEQDSERVEPLKEILRALPAFESLLSIDVLGYFRGARIAWAGMTEPNPALIHWQGALRDELAAGNFIGPRLETFQPHITLARDARRPAHTVLAVPIRWPANRVVLVESLGGIGRPTVYRIIAESAGATGA